LILQIDLRKASVAGPAHAVAPNHFADGTFDPVSLLHLQLKLWALLLPTPLLEGFMQRSDHDRAMGLVWWNTQTPSRTAPALRPELIAVSHFAALLLSELAALRTEAKSSSTSRGESEKRRYHPTASRITSAVQIGASPTSITLLSRIIDFLRECRAAIGTASGRSQ
jgi:hypothetical protein